MRDNRLRDDEWDATINQQRLHFWRKGKRTQPVGLTGWNQHSICYRAWYSHTTGEPRWRTNAEKAGMVKCKHCANEMARWVAQQLRSGEPNK